MPDRMTKWKILSKYIIVAAIISLPFFLAHPVFPVEPSTRPINIKGDTLELRENIYIAKGNVIIREGNKTIRANYVSLNKPTGEVIARGRVKFLENHNYMESDEMRFNLKTGELLINKGNLFLEKDNYHVRGRSIRMSKKEQILIKKAELTTCNDTPPCWKFTGHDIHVRVSQFITAKNVYFKVKNIPVLYLPYVALPLVVKRHTGFLIPRIGYNTDEGFKVNNAFYWVISRSQDATFYGDYYGKKGWGSGFEYRYIWSHYTRGQINTYYIHDTSLHRGRWSINYNHHQRFSPASAMILKVNYLKDKTLYKDLSEERSKRLSRTQDSDIYLNKHKGNMSLHLWGKYTQNLSGRMNGIFQKTPELSFKIMDWKIRDMPIYLGIDGSFIKWSEKNEDFATFSLSPRISSSLRYKGIVFTPSVGATHLSSLWSERRREFSNTYNISVGGTTKLSRRFTSLHFRHIFEPSLQYIMRDGTFTGLPILDMDPPYPFFLTGKVKEDNIRMGKANFFTLVLLNRIITDRGKEPIFVRLTEMFNLTSSPEKGFSNPRIETILTLKDHLFIDIDTIYDHSTGKIELTGTDLSFSNRISHFQMGHRFSRERGIDFLNFNGGLNFKTLTFTGSLWYDIRGKVLRESIFGWKYRSQCWEIAFSYTYRPEEEQFNILFTLVGVGSVGKM